MNDYVVNLKDQQSATADYSWQLDDHFFATVEQSEIEHGTVDVTLCVHRLTNAYDLEFHFSGSVEVACNRCLAPLQQPIEGESTLRVKMGEAFEDDGELITIPENEGTFDVSWNVYEMLALAIPTRHVHPEGECDSEFDFDAPEDDEPQTTDPRWDALKKVLNN